MCTLSWFFFLIGWISSIGYYNLYWHVELNAAQNVKKKKRNPKTQGKNKQMNNSMAKFRI